MAPSSEVIGNPHEKVALQFHWDATLSCYKYDEDHDWDLATALCRYIVHLSKSQNIILQTICSLPWTTQDKPLYERPCWTINLGDYEFMYKQWKITAKLQRLEKIAELTGPPLASLQLTFTPPIHDPDLIQFYTEARRFVHVRIPDQLQLLKFNDKEEEWNTFLPAPKRSLKSIFLRQGLKEEIVKDVQEFLALDQRQEYREKEISDKRIYLLQGSPAQGKKSFVMALASQLGLNVALFNWNQGVQDRDLNIALCDPPADSIVLLENIEIDEKEETLNPSSVTLSGLASALDFMGTYHAQLIFMTTNNMKPLLEEKLINQGRIDQMFNFDCDKTSDKAELIGRLFLHFLPEQKKHLQKVQDLVGEENFSLSLLHKFFWTHRKCQDITQHFNAISHKMCQQKHSFMYN